MEDEGCTEQDNLTLVGLTQAVWRREVLQVNPTLPGPTVVIVIVTVTTAGNMYNKMKMKPTTTMTVTKRLWETSKDDDKGKDVKQGKEINVRPCMSTFLVSQGLHHHAMDSTPKRTSATLWNHHEMATFGLVQAI